MRFNLWHITLFCAGAQLTLSHAHAILKAPGILETREDDDPCPTDRTVCSTGKRHSKYIRFARDTEPQPLMKLPGDDEFKNDLDKFMNKQTKAAKDVVTNDAHCTAVYTTLSDKAANWGVRGMCGCTTLTVVSGKAMYFAHYFENLAFCGSKEEPSNFKKEVLDALDNGIEGVQESLKAHASDFKDQDGLAAFIMAPTTGKSSSLLYKKKVERLQSKVKDIVGINPEVVTYNPEDCDKSEVLLTNALGTALFQYDPKQNKDDPKALSKVWIEKADKYTHPKPASSGSTSPTIQPFDPPSAPSCYPKPNGHYQDAHDYNAKSEASRFCSQFVDNVVYSPDVSIADELTAFPIIQNYNNNDQSDDVFDFTVSSIADCKPINGFNASEPIKGSHCPDLLFNAWSKCNNQGRGGSIKAGCLTYDMKTKN